jgi:acetylornithine deacetylase/succinyl-diaminopimelate desuccinylase-like protein
MTIETKGRSCHASMPDHGENAIQRMGKVIEFVHGPWQEQVAKWSHPLLGASTSAATIVEGGTKNNIVPSRCTLQIDCRLVPGVSQQEVCDAFRQGLNEHLDQTMWEFAAMDMYAGLDTPGRIPFVERLLDLCRDANAQSEPEGVKYFADSGPYSEGGIQAVVFGPGDIAQAHTAAEYLELEQLYQATSILLTLFDRYSGRSLFG